MDPRGPRLTVEMPNGVTLRLECSGQYVELVSEIRNSGTLGKHFMTSVDAPMDAREIFSKKRDCRGPCPLLSPLRVPWPPQCHQAEKANGKEKHRCGLRDREGRRGSRRSSRRGDAAEAGAAEVAAATTVVTAVGAIIRDGIVVHRNRSIQCDGTAAKDCCTCIQGDALIGEDVSGECCTRSEGRGAADFKKYTVS
jgi:hypothetical protein